MTEIVVGIVFLVIAILAFSFAIHLLGEGEAVGLFMLLLSIVVIIIGCALMIYGSESKNKNEVLTYLAERQVVEIKINEKSNEPYYALKDSNFVDLYNFLTYNKNK